MKKERLKKRVLQVLVSPVMGKGFPLEKVPVDLFDTMLIFATGSGISPIKALIEAGDLDATARENVVLFYGAHDPNSMAFLKRCALLTGKLSFSVFMLRKILCELHPPKLLREALLCMMCTYSQLVTWLCENSWGNCVHSIVFGHVSTQMSWQNTVVVWQAGCEPTIS